VGEESVSAPLVPDYAGACLSNVVPTLLERPDPAPSWFPRAALDADQVVLLALDGVGWEQLQARRHLTPTLAAMEGGPIATVLPTTTATALTSLATGTPPGEHGIIGYRIHVHGEVLNILRWTTAAGDARQTIPPQKIQSQLPFLGHRPPVVTRAEFARSGFTLAHLDGTRFTGYRMMSTLVTDVARCIRSSEPFVYAYYDGVDKVSHEYGLGEHYDAELAAVDRLVSDIVSVLPRDATVVVTADHGQVEVGDRLVTIHPDVLTHVSFQSGEGRFRWFHARPGRSAALLEAVEAHHADTGWVRTREQTIQEGWWGSQVTEAARQRLGDVALVACDPVSYVDPADTGPFELVGRHGSLTSAEMLVPLIATSPGGA